MAARIGWSEGRYFTVRNILLDDGLIARGRGKRGSVSEQMPKKKWRRIWPLGVLIAAAQGKRATGGPWTRPDIVGVAIRTFRYLPSEYLEVVTFEGPACRLFGRHRGR